MAYYDDTEFDYDRFWAGRQYEHQSELLALEKLVGNRKLKVSVDVGGGFGRLTRWLAAHSQKVYLVEPSARMRQAAKKYLAKYSQVTIRLGQAQDTNLPAKCADLVMMVRVIHHLPNPAPALAEARRILKPRGLLVLEFANSLHLVARVRSWFTGRPVMPGPVERRRAENIAAGTIPFVNHHPVAMQKLLTRQGYKVVRVLSVSNLRHRVFKLFIPLSVLLGLESSLQTKLAGLYFGPSIFVLAQRVNGERSRTIDKV